MVLHNLCSLNRFPGTKFRNSLEFSYKVLIIIQSSQVASLSVVIEDFVFLLRLEFLRPALDFRIKLVIFVLINQLSNALFL